MYVARYTLHRARCTIHRAFCTMQCEHRHKSGSYLHSERSYLHKLPSNPHNTQKNGRGLIKVPVRTKSKQKVNKKQTENKKEAYTYLVVLIAHGRIGVARLSNSSRGLLIGNVNVVKKVGVDVFVVKDKIFLGCTA